MSGASHCWFTVNGRSYPKPKCPVVVVCIDGCEPAYLGLAAQAGRMPALRRMAASGTCATASAVIPSFTNPNNLSIATGRPPSVHGICGNYFLDPAEGREVMMNDVSFLRAPTIFGAAGAAGARVAVVTAKDKLRALLGAGLDPAAGRSWCFSAEESATTTRADHGLDAAADWLGRPQPDVYSASLSLFVLAAGLKLLRAFRPDVMYLTTTDFIQHKYAPDHPVAIRFHAMIDVFLDRLDREGAVVVVTADHGMQPKFREDGEPAVIFVQTLLDRWLGNGKAHVILPITDPYVVHHGALGSFATIYLKPGVDRDGLTARLSAVPGIERALSGADACAEFELPADRIGDIVLLSEKGMAIGKDPTAHDLSVLDSPLRSHGGLGEQRVPFILNRRLDIRKRRPLRNFDAFPIAFQAASLGDQSEHT